VERDDLISALNEALDARARIPAAEHREHHEWVQAQIQRQRARSEFLIALSGKALPALVWALIAAAGTWIWSFVRSHITWS